MWLRQYRRKRPSLLDLVSEFGLISDGWLSSISSLGDWANAIECWWPPSLRLVILGKSIAVPPGVTHSDSHQIWHGTVVRPQHPSNVLALGYISFGRLSQCTWALKVSVFETGHTRVVHGSLFFDPTRPGETLIAEKSLTRPDPPTRQNPAKSWPDPTRGKDFPAGCQPSVNLRTVRKYLTQNDLSVKVRKNIWMSVKNERISTKFMKWNRPGNICSWFCLYHFYFGLTFILWPSRIYLVVTWGHFDPIMYYIWFHCHFSLEGRENFRICAENTITYNSMKHN